MWKAYGDRDAVGYLVLAVKAILLRYAHLMPADEIVAEHTEGEFDPDVLHPVPAWRRAKPISFCTDWQGQNPDPERETQVSALWSPETLYLRFECRFRSLFVFDDSNADGHRDQLWDRDVVEAFLQPDARQERFYKEFEVSPNGMWIDLDIFPGGRANLKSGLRRSVACDDRAREWKAELAIPMKALVTTFDAKAVWRANFYRVEGSQEPRAYMAWQATNTRNPDFHVPQTFGKLRFSL